MFPRRTKYRIFMDNWNFKKFRRENKKLINHMYNTLESIYPHTGNAVVKLDINYDDYRIILMVKINDEESHTFIIDWKRFNSKAISNMYYKYNYIKYNNDINRFIAVDSQIFNNTESLKNAITSLSLEKDLIYQIKDTLNKIIDGSNSSICSNAVVMDDNGLVQYVAVLKEVTNNVTQKKYIQIADENNNIATLIATISDDGLINNENNKIKTENQIQATIKKIEQVQDVSFYKRTYESKSNSHHYLKIITETNIKI